MVDQTSNDKQKYVFGPVPSRRLGRSLGVDLIPFKYCSYNCVYCQLGRTPMQAIDRREYVPMETLVSQIQEALAAGPKPDYITLAGSGEPTLYLRIGELIDRIHAMTDVPVDIITNGSTLWIDDVFNAVVKTELIIPTLTAGDAATFQKINRPAPEVTFDRLIAGLEHLSKVCPQKVWLEVFIVNGVNDDPRHVQQIAAFTDRFKFAKVQLNTAVRPPAEKEVQPVSRERLEQLAELFSPAAEIIAEFPKPKTAGHSHVSDETILELILRHPCTLDDVVNGLGTSPAEASAAIERLLKQNKILSEKRQDKDYYYVR
jgi:wyosine [tRNA(Phe)-imidazoG37] synthetase (radical SAM superfamily)